MQISSYPDMNAKLLDICLGTSAAPTFFPSHQFENIYDDGKIREFNLIDGGIVTTNPVCSTIYTFFLPFLKIAISKFYYLNVALKWDFEYTQPYNNKKNVISKFQQVTSHKKNLKLKNYTLWAYKLIVLRWVAEIFCSHSFGQRFYIAWHIALNLILSSFIFMGRLLSR